jgi:23S rRNA (uracil1939-C5)-methyltransferase
MNGPAGRFGTAREVTLRCGARTGERLAVLTPTAAGASLPADVEVVGDDELSRGRQAYLHEEVAGRRLRVSARSFFQSSVEGAELLVALVTDALAGADDGPLVDAYGGVGLFAATVGGGRQVTVLESSPSALADARANLPGARVVAGEVARWRPAPAVAVVADPPRTGLGRQGTSVLAATGARHLALVSCDPASLGRDAGLLGEHGFRLEWSNVVDLFPGTPHVETVSRFAR